MASKTVRFDKALLTPLCRFNWVWVYTTKDTDSGAKYMVDCIFNPAEMDTPAFKALVAAAEKVGREAFPNGEYENLVAAGKFGTPFNKNAKKIDAKTGEMAEGYEAGGVWITPKSKDKPGVKILTSAGMADVSDEREIYNGIWGHASLDLYSYTTKGKGVTFGLRNIIKVKDDTVLSGRGQARAEDDFAGIAAPPEDAAGATTAAGLF